MTVFKDEDELLRHMEDGAAWAVVIAKGMPYIVTCDEDGEWFVQGMPFEDDSPERPREDWHNPNNEWLSDKPAYWFPVTLLGDSESSGSGSLR